MTEDIWAEKPEPFDAGANFPHRIRRYPMCYRASEMDAWLKKLKASFDVNGEKEK